MERVALAMESLYVARLDDHLGDLAHHYRRSDSVTKAVEYLGRAGQQAMQRSAYADAISSLTAAIGLLQRLQESPERLQRELLLQLAVCPALWGLWVMHAVRGEFRTAYELAERLLRRAQKARDPVLLLYAHFALGNTSFWMGEFLPAREHLEMASSLYDPERHRPLAFRYGGFDAGIACLSYAAWTLWTLGYPDQALKRGNEALALAQALSHPLSLALAEIWVGALRQSRGEARATQETAESAMALSAEHGLTDYLARATTLRGWAMTEQRHNEEGIALIQEGLAASRATGSELYRPYFLCLLAEACTQTGRLDEGLSALTEALAAANEHEDRHYEPEAHRLKGELVLRRQAERSGAGQTSPRVAHRPVDSNIAEAQSCFARAIE